MHVLFWRKDSSCTNRSLRMKCIKPQASSMLDCLPNAFSPWWTRGLVIFLSGDLISATEASWISFWWKMPVSIFCFRRAGWHASSPGQRIFQKENAQDFLPHMALSGLAPPAWLAKNDGTIVCLLWQSVFAIADGKEQRFTQNKVQKTNQCKIGKKPPVKSYESYNLSYKLD